MKDLPQIIPIEPLADLLARGRVAFFLGAGASLHEASSTATSLNVEGGASKQGRLPSARELADRLAVDMGQLECLPKDLLQVTTLYQLLGSRRALVDALHDALEEQQEPGEIHRFLAGLDRLSVVVTTNYDRFIERALTDAGRLYHCVVNVFNERFSREPGFLWYPPGEASPRTVGQDQNFDERFPLVFKAHGSLGLPDEFRDTFVISEEDYYEMAGREHQGNLLPLQVHSKLLRSHVVFLGYSLRDIHLRHAVLLDQPSEHTHYLFNKHIDECDRIRFRALKIRAFESDCSSFAHLMRDALRGMC